MRKLLRANMRRMWLGKVFWLQLLGLPAFCVVVCMNQYMNMLQYDYTIFLEYLLFGFLSCIGITVAVFVSMFTGTEYSDGTIRNKLVAGKSRRQIYLADFLTVECGTLLACAASFGVTLTLGIPLFGGFHMDVKTLLLFMIVSILVSVSYTALFHMIAMVCANKTVTAMINIILAFGLLFWGIYLVQSLGAPEMIDAAEMVNGEINMIKQENPAYLTGMKREIYQFFCDFTPGGQVMQTLNLRYLYPCRMIISDIVIVLASVAGGIFWFEQKDVQ